MFAAPWLNRRFLREILLFMDFIYPGFFPPAACPVAESLPSGDDGLKYPIGFSLEDYMAIFWKVDGWTASGSDGRYVSGTGFGVATESANYLPDMATYRQGDAMRELVCNAVSRTFYFQAEVHYVGTGYTGVLDPYDFSQTINRAILTIQEPTYFINGLYYPQWVLTIPGVASTIFPLRRVGSLTIKINETSYQTPVGINATMNYSPADVENFVDLTISAASERPTI